MFAKELVRRVNGPVRDRSKGMNRHTLNDGVYAVHGPICAAVVAAEGDCSDQLRRSSESVLAMAHVYGGPKWDGGA